jgi:THO complex subunit 2
LENIKSLIGYFDLDPNRVLDVILDAFLINVFEYWDFFVELLLSSPWSEKRLVQKSIVASVLGFKFRYYSPPEAKGTTPIQLVWIAAIMIKHNIVELDALYPHLSPPDEEISGELWDAYEEKMKLEAESMRSGDNVCRISNLQFLSDPAAVKPDESKRVVKVNEKANICACLAAIGSLKHSRDILLRLPMLYRLHPEIAVNISRLLGEILEPVYAPLRPSSLFTKPTMPGRLSLPPAHPLVNVDRTMEDIVVSAKRGAHVQRGGFFYQNWKSDLGVYTCTTFASALAKVKLFLRMIGFYLCKDPNLIVKIIRIAKAHILVYFFFFLN